MRVARCYLKDDGVEQVFHLMSRVVDKRMVFEEEEKAQFRRLIRQVEGFSGCEVLTYCIMGNHFHILLRVPARPDEIPESEVIMRLAKIYSREWVAGFEKQIEKIRETGNEDLVEEKLNKVRSRMYDVSEYVKCVKQRFTQWYNRENEREGTLWEQRFKSYLVEPALKHLIRVAQYIDLNPVRAGLVKRAVDYPYSGAGELKQKSPTARQNTKCLYVLGGVRHGIDRCVSHYLERLEERNREMETGDSPTGKMIIPHGGMRSIGLLSNALLIGGLEFLAGHKLNTLGPGFPRFDNPRCIHERGEETYYFRKSRRKSIRPESGKLAAGFVPSG